MGPVDQYITGTLDMTISELEKAIATDKTDGYLFLQLVDVEIIAVFPNPDKPEPNRVLFIHELTRISTNFYF